jgi:translation initiation factor IF-2
MVADSAGTTPDEAAKKAVEEKPSVEPPQKGLKVLGKIDLGTIPTGRRGKVPKKEDKPKKEEVQVKAKEESKPVTSKAPEKKPEDKKEQPKPKEEPVKEVKVPEKILEAEKKQVENKEPVKAEKTPNKEEPKVVKKEEPKKVEKAPVKKAEPAVKVGQAPMAKAPEAKTEEDEATIRAEADKLKGLKVVGKIELPADSGGRGSRKNKKDGDKNNRGDNKKDGEKKKRTRLKRPTDGRKSLREEYKKSDNKSKAAPTQNEIKDSFKKTMNRMGPGGSNQQGNRKNSSKYRREKRQKIADEEARRLERSQEEATKLKVTEFISANELATLMDVSVNDLIGKSMEMGMFVSINQRLEADSITMLADEFGFEVEFTSAEDEKEVILEEEDNAEDLEERAPVVTIMGHVDHGKTSLLDYIRDAQVVEGEAGGITQHIGAYDVVTESGRRIAFLDTPGHEAFTAMRARGAKLTDVAIIVVAADDDVMPQTVEAINHAQIAEVPIVIAINKIDKPTANVHKVKESLANINVLVEDWGGKYQCYEISAKTGQGIEDLLEGVLLEAEVLELKANPDKNAVGSVVEASLDKGRGYLATLLVQAGTLKIGDIMLAGSHYGRVKAMFDHRGNRKKKVGPSTPVQVLGLNGAPQAGDKINVMDSEREAREIATKRDQINREQSIRATRRTTLSDIGRRIAIGNFQQLNVIIKGDVDGSVEALSDSLLKLSTEEIEVNILHKAVGPISESDVLLATTSDAIVIGFQVRPTPMAKSLAEREEVEIRLYSVIYNTIDDVKQAMEGLLSPDIEEDIVGNAEVREVFRISKVGTIAGCMVRDGYIKRNNPIRLIRDGIVVYGGDQGGSIKTLKRFKDDVGEVKQGFECGIGIESFNDIQEGDVIESFERKEVKRKLK